MSKKQPHKKYKISATEQLVIVLSNSKYSYQHFTDFHETILEILDHDDLSFLTEGQMKNTLFFIDIVIGLLDAPIASSINEKNTITSLSELASIKHCDDAAQQHSAAKDNLIELLEWMEKIVLKKQITIEEMLDQFYALKFIKIRDRSL